MLSQISLLPTFTPSIGIAEPEPSPTETGLYVFSNYITEGLMGVEYPLELGSQVALLLRLALDEREYNLPNYALSESDAAKKLGISRATLRRWGDKGWIYYWREWERIGDSNALRIIPDKIYSAIEVEALSLAKPRAF